MKVEIQFRGKPDWISLILAKGPPKNLNNENLNQWWHPAGRTAKETPTRREMDHKYLLSRNANTNEISIWLALLTSRIHVLVTPTVNSKCGEEDGKGNAKDFMVICFLKCNAHYKIKRLHFPSPYHHIPRWTSQHLHKLSQSFISTKYPNHTPHLA